MSFTPDFAQQGQIADSMRRSQVAMSHREHLAEVVVDGGFVLAAALLWAIRPPGVIDVWPALLCIGLLALATRVEFDTPFGFTVATQLAFVPLIFAVPLALVPIAVVAGLMLASVPELRDGSMRPSRLITRIGNAWFAIGPVAVFELAGTPPLHAGAWLLLAALAAQFLVDLLVSWLRFALAHQLSFREHLKSSWIYLIDLSLTGVGLAVAEEVHGKGYAPLAMLGLLGLLAVFARERRVRIEQMIELNDAYHGTALVLGDVVEADDGYTGEHSRGVVRLCLDVAGQLGLSADQRRNLEFGALLHDVGKIAIPKEIINKPGKLDEHEWTVIKTHTIEGQKLLDTVGGFMGQVGLIVRSHHERWDGQGYPDGLMGEQIPLESRIVSACDTWNAMRTDRSYRKRLPFERAEAEMLSIAGTQLDPRVVAGLLVAVEGERETEPVTVPEVAPQPEQLAERPQVPAATPAPSGH
jgi:HD-GYP domain-containing protein (c-di-GMP phosphodiesterase class II)